jgi:hypothetical protein
LEAAYLVFPDEVVIVVPAHGFGELIPPGSGKIAGGKRAAHGGAVTAFIILAASAVAVIGSEYAFQIP